MAGLGVGYRGSLGRWAVAWSKQQGASSRQLIARYCEFQSASLGPRPAHLPARSRASTARAVLLSPSGSRAASIRRAARVAS